MFMSLHSLFTVVQILNLFGWIVATAVGLAVVYGLYDDFEGHILSVSLSALYNALSRTAWGACVAWVIFSCVTGNGGKQKHFFHVSVISIFFFNSKTNSSIYKDLLAWQSAMTSHQISLMQSELKFDTPGSIKEKYRKTDYLKSCKIINYKIYAFLYPLYLDNWLLSPDSEVNSPSVGLDHAN